MGRILPLVLVIIAGGCGQPTPPATAPAADFSDQRLPAVTLGNGQSYAPYVDPDLVRRVDDQGNTIPNKHGQKVLGEDRRGGWFLIWDPQAGTIIVNDQGQPVKSGRYVDDLDAITFRDGVPDGQSINTKGVVTYYRQGKPVENNK